MATHSQSHDEPADETLGLNAFQQPPAEEGLSLDKLNAAFAEMLGTGDDPYTDAGNDPTGESEADAAGIMSPAPEIPPDDASEISPGTILEAMLFVGDPANQPLTSTQVAGLMRGVRPAEIDTLVAELNRQYAQRRCPYQIVSEGAGYRLKLRDEFARVRDRFYGKARQTRLSQAAIEVLAAVAYHGTLTSDEVSKLRGTPSGTILSQLVRRNLLQHEREGSKRADGRYATTPRFLELFRLGSLEDLPRSQDIEGK